MSKLTAYEFGWCRWFALQPLAKKLQIIATLSDAEAVQLRYTWAAWARDKQLEELEAPGDWVVWLLLAGRGFGKSRVGAEQVNKWAWQDSHARIALVGRTAADVRDVMVEGESGILASSPPWFRPLYQPTRRRLTWPNGAQATTYSADQPDALRGPQHTKAWADEPAAWQYEDTWDQMMFGLRLGDKPQVVATTTPKPTRLIRTLVKARTTHLTVGTTYENRENLAPTFFSQVIAKYEGTTLGRQELLAQLLEDAEGALWNRQTMIEPFRVTRFPDLIRIVVGVDPAVADPTHAKDVENIAETGIVVAGIDAKGHGYVLDDRSLQASPLAWGKEVVAAYHRLKADRVIGEQNNGGALVEANIRSVDPNVSYEQVWASRGKYIRAEPVASFYEQGRIHHVGTFPYLEDQQCQWEPLSGMKSPDRLDALVWAFTKLLVDPKQGGGMIAIEMPKDVKADDVPWW